MSNIITLKTIKMNSFNQTIIMNPIICDDECVERLITNLNVLGKIGPNFKINTKEKYLQLDDTTYWQGVVRWWRGDSRKTMYEKIHSTIVTSLRVITMAIGDFNERPDQLMTVYNDNTPREFLTLMYEVLHKTKTGLENLRDTYDNDPTLASRLQMNVNSIKNQIMLISRSTGLT